MNRRKLLNLAGLATLSAYPFLKTGLPSAKASSQGKTSHVGLIKHHYLANDTTIGIRNHNAGLQSMGMSGKNADEILHQMTLHMILNKKLTIAYFAVHLSKNDLLKKLISLQSGFPVDKLPYNLNYSQSYAKFINSAKKLSGSSLTIYDKKSMPSSSARIKMMNSATKNKKFDIVIINGFDKIINSKNFNLNELILGYKQLKSNPLGITNNLT